MNNPAYFEQAQKIARGFMQAHPKIKGDSTPLKWTDPQDGLMTVVLTAGPKVTGEANAKPAKRTTKSNE